ncbi:MAG: hypothetical protein ABIH48_03025 [Candidatus Falkowbacteria bacterium]
MANNKTVKNLNDGQEKRDTLEMFKEGLINVLEMDQVEDTELISYYNTSLIRILLEDKDFVKKLSNAFLENQEKLTYKEFVLDSKPTRPTVANWLKDFIQQNGSGIFDKLKLSNYLTSSKNVKLLDDGEKKLVKKLLLLYYNLAFFPESMNEIKVGDWEIIPLEKEEVFTKVKSKMPTPTAGQAPVAPTNNQIVDYQASENKDQKLEELEKKIKSQNMKGEIENEEPEVESGELKELQEMAEQYKEGSLERKAVEEEIKKLEIRSKK